MTVELESSVLTFDTNALYHVAVSKQISTNIIRMFVNGTLVGSMVDPGPSFGLTEFNGLRGNGCFNAFSRSDTGGYQAAFRGQIYSTRLIRGPGTCLYINNFTPSYLSLNGIQSTAV